MNLEEIRNYCLSKPGSSEEFPFDENTLAFKVGGKIFLLTDIRHTTGINLKCDPEMAIELRERHNAVKLGYHMNKKHWNTIEIPGDYKQKELFEWIDNSYNLVVNSLPAKIKNQITTAQSN